MTLELNTISREAWIDARKTEPVKLNNVKKIVKFNTALLSLKDEFDGRIDYFKFNKRLGTVPPIGTLEYTENTPVFEYFKIMPFGYYLNNFPDDDIWRECDIDDNIDKMFVDANKYKQPSETFQFDNPYILFPLQSNSTFLPHSFNIDIFLKTIMWANKEKRHILFKLHPFTTPNSHILKYWNYLEKLGMISDYTVLVDKTYNLDRLIDNADSVWTFSSGAGMQALMKGKPVAHFWKAVDYFPLSTYATTPEEAYRASTPSEDARKRFLTWYYTKLTINSESDDLIERLRLRMEKCFVKRETDIRKIL